MHNANSSQKVKGCLYLVATPIGNLGDISERALRILNEVDIIAAEDTRHTKKLLSYFKIAKPMMSLYKENERYKAEKVIDLLLEGRKVALVSDAGMPGISDPGSFLVKEVVDRKIQIIPIPGPSAFLLALTASALPTRSFVFEGFLARRKKERREQLSVLANEPRTIILYESPHRIKDTLKDLKEYFGAERFIVIARELTKIHEEFWRGNLSDAVPEWEAREIKGEFTLVIEGKMEQEKNVEDITEDYRKFHPEIIRRIELGEKLSAIVREISVRERISRRGLYQWFLKEKNNMQDT